MTTALTPQSPVTTPTTSSTSTMSTCRFCWQPIVSASGPYRPLWVHAGTRRAGCEGGPLPIAEPVGPAPAVQGALFDLPTALAGRRSPR
jgi:hypothetical protein